jgi:5-methyltetrahydrofolate--homocysteine methyltransferase
MDLKPLTEAICIGRRLEAVKQTKAAIDAGIAAGDILKAMIDAMDDVGRRFQCNEIFIPEMLIAARAMKESMALLEPLLVKAGIKPETTIVLGTVQGDLHDIGKNLVGIMWKGANFGVVDLGTNVAPDAFVSAVKKHNAQVVGLSALLTTTMPAMKTTVDALRNAAIPNLKIVIGGAPVTHDFANQIGADGYSSDAAGAVDLVRGLLAANVSA